jgi:hypothetical protein
MKHCADCDKAWPMLAHIYCVACFLLRGGYLRRNR